MPIHESLELASGDQVRRRAPDDFTTEFEVFHDYKPAIQRRAATPQPKERSCVRRTSRSGEERHKVLEQDRNPGWFPCAAAGAPHTAALRKIVAARDDFDRYVWR